MSARPRNRLLALAGGLVVVLVAVLVALLDRRYASPPVARADHAPRGVAPDDDAVDAASLVLEPAATPARAREAAPEPRDVEEVEAALVEAPSGETRPFHGRVVAAEDGRPLAGVDVRAFADARGESAPIATSDFNGAFRIDAVGPKHEDIVLTQDGRGPALVRVRGLDSTAEEAVLVRLSRAGALVGRVEGAGRVRVVAETPRYHLAQPGGFVFGAAPKWSAPVGDDGRYSLVDLPPQVPLEVTLEGEAGGVTRRLSEPVLLEPGEERALDWRLAELGTILGVAREEDGSAAADQVLWLLPPDEGFGGLLRSYADPAHTTRAGPDGRFAIDGVPAGAWVIGPAPERDGAGAAVAQATPVVVPQGGATVEVELVVHRGHRIEGVVLDSDGEPVEGASVHASLLEGGGFFHTNTADDGTFALEPVLPGRYHLQSQVFGGERDLAPSPPVEAEADERGVELRLARGCRIVGRVVDDLTGGELPAARVSLHPVEGQGYQTTSGHGPGFALGGIVPGRYHLAASTDDGRVGTLRDLVLGPGEVREGVEVRVARGGWVEVHYRGAGEYAGFEIEQDGVILAADGIRSGTTDRRACPPGSALVRLEPHARDGVRPPTVERTVQVVRDEVVVVEFELDD